MVYTDLSNLKYVLTMAFCLLLFSSNWGILPSVGTEILHGRGGEREPQTQQLSKKQFHMLNIIIKRKNLLRGIQSRF